MATRLGTIEKLNELHSFPEQEVLAIARKFASNPRRETLQALSLNSHLERDLGLDSLGRCNMARYIEQAIGMTIPEQVLSNAETLGDLFKNHQRRESFVSDYIVLRDGIKSSYKCVAPRAASRKLGNERFATPFSLFIGLIYAGYTRLVFGLSATFLGIAVLLTQGLRQRRWLMQCVARLLVRLARVPLQVDGSEYLDEVVSSHRPGVSRSPVIVVANHASYIDGIVLAAILPPDFSFVVKSELQSNFLKRMILKRLGVVFVRRFDSVQAAKDLDKMVAALEHGESIVVFPEGTFRDSPGLLPFRMGAFVAAAQVGVPIVPVVINGTREVLRGDDFFVKSKNIDVIVCSPLYPQGSDWSAAVTLRAIVRDEILRHCCEPDLSIETDTPPLVER